MSFRLSRALAVYRKDLLDLRKNRGLLWSMLALPLVIVVTPLGLVMAYVRNPTDPGLKAIALYYDLTVDLTNVARFLIDKVLADWFVIYLVMPVFVPILISSHAVAGEKEKRTLEPLLASPVTPLELVVGKSLASLVPSVLICTLAFVLLCVGVDIVAWPVAKELILPNSMWSFGVFVIAPLFAFFGNGVAVLISARVGDSRLAQQLAGLMVLPLIGLAAGQFGGWLKAGAGYYAIIGGVVLLLDVVIVVAARRLFDRERLMTRWG
ncbi:MAG: ABC transporter permease subunit [Myxococcales bacterium]|nr:ABC transporter permease subunit [Myxococcales bacterium]MDP3502406.1 ABC transporter permease subunit [Myxococcales bacterium]